MANIFTSAIAPIVKEMVKADAARDAMEAKLGSDRESRARGPAPLGDPYWDAATMRARGEDDPKTVAGQFKAADVPLRYHEAPWAFERRPAQARPAKEPLVGRYIDSIENRLDSIVRLTLWAAGIYAIFKGVAWYMSPKAFELRENRKHELQLEVGNKSRKKRQ